jgi:hypothetical protein
VASHDEREDVIDYAAALSLEMTVLVDRDAVVFDPYGWLSALDSTAYPQDRIIDADGRIAEASGSYDPDTLRARLDALLRE